MRIAAARLDGLPVRYDVKTGTIDLSGWAGQLELDVALRARR
jgi:hypothetical protein